MRDYSNVLSKGPSYQIFEGVYPSNPFIGIPSKGGDVPVDLIDLETGLPPENIPFTDFQSALDFISNMSESDLVEYQITDRAGYIENLQETFTQDTTIASQFWGAMDQIKDSLIAMPDVEIIEKLNSEKGWTTYSDHIIPAYNNSRLKATRWDGWCGPAAVAWIYRGLYSSYNGTYLPLAGESSFPNNGRYLDFNTTNTGRYFFNSTSSTNENWVKTQSNAIDGGLYYKIAQQTSMFGWLSFGEGPTYPWQIDNCLRSATGSAYTSNWALGLFARSNIENYNLPVIINVDQYSHYIVAFGTRHAYWHWSIGSHWWKITITIPDIFNHWFLVTDNGHKTSGHNYMPYWRYYNMTYGELYYNVKRN